MVRIKGPTIFGKGTEWERVQAAAKETVWHINPIKRWLYRYIVNDLNKILWKLFEKEIEL